MLKVVLRILVLVVRFYMEGFVWFYVSDNGVLYLGGNKGGYRKRLNLGYILMVELIVFFDRMVYFYFMWNEREINRVKLGFGLCNLEVD